MFTEIKTTIVERDYSQHMGRGIILIKDANGFWGWQVGTVTTPCNFRQPFQGGPQHLSRRRLAAHRWSPTLTPTGA